MRELAPAIRERQGPAVHASRAAAWVRGKTRDLLIAAGAGLFLAFVGAFGTAEAPAGLRVIYWVSLLLAGAVLGALIAAVFDRRGWLGARPWLQIAAIALAITFPLTGLVSLVTWAMFGRDAGFAAPAGFFLPVLAVTVVMTSITQLAQRTPPTTHAAPAAEAARPVRFLDRLPPKLRGAELFAVEAEDHYLRLHTSRGSDLILMRLADAVAELEGLEGAQTHRSWWVARSAVADARRNDGRAVLRLRDGAEAPVSRTYARALREAGWF